MSVLNRLGLKPGCPTEDEILLWDGKEERAVVMNFFDGHAEEVGGDTRLTYPKIDDLTETQIDEINLYCGGAVFDSGIILPFDVALKYGIES